MDIETRRELDRLRRNYQQALQEVGSAENDEQELAAWHGLQTLGWELNALLPTTPHRLQA